MTISKSLVDAVNEKLAYENFSEEVEILKSTSAGNMTVYTVKNKNSITFQNVPGMAGLSDRGYMGYINGDRARPIMLSGSVKTTKTESSASDPGWSFAIADLTNFVVVDIELTVTSPYGSSTATAIAYITAN